MAIAPERLQHVPELEIRAMAESDLAQVAEVERRSYQFPWSEGIFRDCLRVGYVCRIARVAGSTVAHGIMSLGAGEAHVLNVCVDPGHRCRGIGERLLRHLIERARAANMSDAFLEVRPSNVAAIRLYRTLGFEQIGVRRGYYQATNGREDAAVLRLALR